MEKRHTLVILGIFLFTPVLMFLLIRPKMGEVMMGKMEDIKPEKIEIVKKLETDGSTTETVDASQGHWVYFSFDTGVHPIREDDDPPAGEWELAFQRKKIVTNSGVLNSKGTVGVQKIEQKEFKDVVAAPDKGYQQNILEDRAVANKILEKWYDYNFFKHTLTPKKEIYLVQANDKRVAKMKIETYYCGKEELGACYTIRYKWL